MVILEGPKTVSRIGIPEFRFSDSGLDHIGEMFSGLVHLAPITATDEDSSVIELSQDYGANYGHWIHDILPILLLLKNRRVNVQEVEIHQSTFHTFHARQWLSLIGVNRSLVTDRRKIKVEYPLSFTSLVHPVGISLLREFIPAAMAAYPRSDRPVVLMQRCQHGSWCGTSRNLESRLDFLESMIPVNVEVVYLEDTPMLQQISIFNSAKMIIGIHGTGLSNVVFCRPDCKVIEIRSPLFWNCTYAEIGSYLGLDFTLIHGVERHGNSNLHLHSVYVPPEILSDFVRGKLKSD